MDLNTGIDVNFARVVVNFQMIPMTYFCNIFLIYINIKVPLILHTKFQPNIPSHFREMDLNARVDVNYQMVIVTLITLQISFFHFDINQHQGPTNTPY